MEREHFEEKKMKDRQNAQGTYDTHGQMNERMEREHFGENKLKEKQSAHGTHGIRGEMQGWMHRCFC